MQAPRARNFEQWKGGGEGRASKSLREERRGREREQRMSELFHIKKEEGEKPESSRALLFLFIITSCTEEKVNFIVSTVIFVRKLTTTRTNGLFRRDP